MRRLLTGLAVLAFGVVTVHAADDPSEAVPGKVAVVKPGKLAKIIAKPISPAVLGLPTAPNAPTTAGARLSIVDTADGSARLDVTLPSQGWKGLGSPAGASGYKYKGAGSLSDPCKSVLIKTKIIKMLCKGAAVDLDQPVGDLTAVLTTGPASKSYCTILGGTEVKNTPDLYKAKNATALETACACPDAGSLTFRNTTGTGDSGSVTTNGGATSALANAGLYNGSGSATLSQPAIVPDSEKSLVMDVECCVGDTLHLGPTTDAETGGSGERCTVTGCKFGAPLPIPNPLSTATSTCVINTYTKDATGEASCSTGETRLDMPLNAAVHLTGDQLVNRCSGGTNPGARCPAPGPDPVNCTGGGTCVADPALQPCPICNPTTAICNGGINNGMACVVDGGVGAGGSQYPVSHDCPPNPVLNIGDLPIPFLLTTGTQIKTATPGSSGTSTMARVFCGFCRDTDDTLGFGICAPGSTANAGGVCTVAADCCADPMVCPVNNCGSEQPCDPTAVSTGCAQPREACEQRNDGAFGPGGGGNMTIMEAGIAPGSLADHAAKPGRLVSVFCIPPTFNQTIDQSADLPGPGAVSLPGLTDLDSPSGAFLDEEAPF